MPPRESPWLDRIGWALMAAGAVALFSLLWVAESRIERKERLIHSIMHRYGWSPAQIEGIADGRIDPYSETARPREGPNK